MASDALFADLLERGWPEWMAREAADIEAGESHGCTAPDDDPDAADGPAEP